MPGPGVQWQEDHCWLGDKLLKLRATECRAPHSMAGPTNVTCICSLQPPVAESQQCSPPGPRTRAPPAAAAAPQAGPEAAAPWSRPWPTRPAWGARQQPARQAAAPACTIAAAPAAAPCWPACPPSSPPPSALSVPTPGWCPGHAAGGRGLRPIRAGWLQGQEQQQVSLCLILGCSSWCLQDVDRTSTLSGPHT
jgi:hypothetical protein